MKVTIEQVSKASENEVIIRYHTMDESVHNLLHFLELPDQKLLGEIEKEMHILDPEKIYYIESVDNKVFIYGENQVYESRKKLYELELELINNQFFRASKSMILNIKKIESVRPLFDGRFEASLKNKEKVFISRKYVAVLKQKLGL